MPVLDRFMPMLAMAALSSTAGAQPDMGCGVTVVFGSFATGIDRNAALRAERLVRVQAGVTGITRTPPGIEGEYALCVRTESPEAAARMFGNLRQAFAAPVRAPVSITGPCGSFSAPLERPSRRR